MGAKKLSLVPAEAHSLENQVKQTNALIEKNMEIAKELKDRDAWDRAFSNNTRDLATSQEGLIEVSEQQQQMITNQTVIILNFQKHVKTMAEKMEEMNNTFKRQSETLEQIRLEHIKLKRRALISFVCFIIVSLGIILFNN